jgi:hypothetical protein
MNKLMILIIMIGLTSITGCQTYVEPGYNPGSTSHRYEGRYSNDQYRSDSKRARVTAERQREYDRHQNQVQNRTVIQNRETRKNIRDGALILGGAAAIGVAVQRYRRR